MLTDQNKVRTKTRELVGLAANARWTDKKCVYFTTSRVSEATGSGDHLERNFSQLTVPCFSKCKYVRHQITLASV